MPVESIPTPPAPPLRPVKYSAPELVKAEVEANWRYDCPETPKVKSDEGEEVPTPTCPPPKTVKSVAPVVEATVKSWVVGDDCEEVETAS